MTEWEAAVGSLVEQVKTWVPSFHGPEGERMKDALTFAYDGQPLLGMKAAGGTTIFLEPARFAMNHLPTVFNLYAYPTLRRVRLVGPVGEAWEIQSSEGVVMNYGWNREDFVRLLTELANESVPSRV